MTALPTTTAPFRRTDPTSRASSRPRFIVALLTSFALVAAACGGGPDLTKTIDAAAAVNNRSSAAALGVDGTSSDLVWQASGSPTQVADSIAGVEMPDERSDDAGGDVFLLYESGTVWVTPAEGGGSAVLLYSDNDRAYTRHNTILIANSRWGTRVNNYRTSGSSSSNGFRGGGSSSGK